MKEEWLNIGIRKIFWSISERFPPLEDPSYLHILGIQFLALGETGEAVVYLERAYQARPVSEDFTLSLSKAYFQAKKYRNISRILTRFS